MYLNWVQPHYFIMMAGAFFVLGYLVINQKLLRLLLLIGTGFYLAYYYTAADQPLWDTIYISSIMAMANLIGLASLYLRISPLAVPRQHRDLYERFSDLPPGDFRELLAVANRQVLTSDMELTREGAPVNRLYYIVSGRLEVEKRSERFAMPPGVFVGEVAYLTNRRSSATTFISAGAEILIWDPVELRKRAKRKARFRLALEAMISKDLAMKVAYAVAPHNENLDHEREVRALEVEGPRQV